MIEFQNVGMRYNRGEEILRDINLNLKEGSFHFLTGDSGAGKTSLLRLMYLAHRPSRGVINLFGQDIVGLNRSELPMIRRKIGVVFQGFQLIPHLSVFENVALPLKIIKTPPQTIRSHVCELLSWVGLGQHMDSFPHALSGGQQQRVSIARAVIGRPKIILADEPTGNVDDGMAVRLLTLFEQLNNAGTTLIIATHNLSLIKRFQKPVFHIEKGEIKGPA